MKCPYCSTVVHVEWDNTVIGIPTEGMFADEGYSLLFGFCPDCDQFIVFLQHGKYHMSPDFTGNIYESLESVDAEFLIYPRHSNGRSLHLAIPDKYVEIFRESEQVNDISPRASATLSRYLLQMVLHEELGIRKENLYNEIHALEEKTDIPGRLISMLQVFRKVANFGAHPNKGPNSQEIINVSKSEADVLLDLLEQLLDYVFVKPYEEQKFLNEIKDKYGIIP